MTIFFQPDHCLPHDPTGFGYWLQSHYNEHRQFIQIAQTQLTIPVFITDYNLAYWSDEPKIAQRWLLAHEQIHEQLRTLTNVGGIDLSQVDLTQDDQWYEWMDDHAQEHMDFRQVFGITS
jgi:hypothetical protein